MNKNTIWLWHWLSIFVTEEEADDDADDATEEKMDAISNVGSVSGLLERAHEELGGAIRRTNTNTRYLEGQ